MAIRLGRLGVTKVVGARIEVIANQPDRTWHLGAGASFDPDEGADRFALGRIGTAVVAIPDPIVVFVILASYAVTLVGALMELNAKYFGVFDARRSDNVVEAASADPGRQAGVFLTMSTITAVVAIGSLALGSSTGHDFAQAQMTASAAVRNDPVQASLMRVAFVLRAGVAVIATVGAGANFIGADKA